MTRISMSGREEKGTKKNPDNESDTFAKKKDERAISWFRKTKTTLADPTTDMRRGREDMRN